MTVYRVIWRGLCCVLLAAGVAAGAVLLPGELWVPVVFVAVVLTLTTAAAGVVAGRRAPVTPHSVLRPVTICLAIFGVLGLAAVLHEGAAYLLVLLAASSPWAIEWCPRRLGRHPAPPPAPVSTGQLCREWHESYQALSQAATLSARLRIVKARERCLDELERRDPAGLQAWLASTASAGGDPTRFLATPDKPLDQDPT
ncbi:hypothetical protein AB0H36_32160 [Kribbella sp. NPDC050820]|uniref:hypothetical protein n=1 Tax=Kribbella sp. NPDC050820 TaxID=3155408 RepID=UPI0033E4F5D4